MRLCPYCGVELKMIGGELLCPNCGIIDSSEDSDENDERGYIG